MNDIKKIRVGVLMGGRSAEHEVSFNSGRTVCDHLDSTRYTVVPLFQKNDGELYILPWRFLHRGKTTDFEHRLAIDAQLISWDQLKGCVDFVYIAAHGRYAEDGILQGVLELYNIPYLGSKIFASALCMDKKIQKTFLRQSGIETPKDIVISADRIVGYDQHKAFIVQELSLANIVLPFIVKPYKEGSSLGVSIVNNFDELLHALEHACFINSRYAQDVLIEEKLEGMEFSCITLTDYKNGTWLALPPTEIVVESEIGFFDYGQKYMPGRAHKFTPARCAQAVIKKIQDTCVAVTQALGITNLSRIDGFVTKDDRVIIIDPNTFSGLGPASFLFREAAEINMSHTQLINHLIETELHNYGLLEPIIMQEKRNFNSMAASKIRVAVLMGGDSNEREISFESGRNITYKLSPQKYEAIPLFVSQTMELFRLNQSLLVRNSTKEVATFCDPASKIAWTDLPGIADFVFIGLHGGKGENGTVQGMLEMIDMPYNGSSVLVSALCMDKYKTNQFLASHGFDVPQSYFITKNAWSRNIQLTIDCIKATLSFPLIIKPHDDGCSMFVKKVNDDTELLDAIEEIFAAGKEGALAEEFVTGMELTVGVLGNKIPRALPPSQAVTQSAVLSIEEKFLPGAGENQTPAPLPADSIVFVQKTIESVYKTVGCVGYARIDCFYQSDIISKTGKERLIILEINTLPGMTPATCIFHQAAEAGINPMDFIDQIVEFGFEQHQKNRASGLNQASGKHVACKLE